MHAGSTPSPSWMRYTLLAAAAYNLAWGALVIVQPMLFFDLVGATRPNYPEIWQCVGMIVGVYGVGYAIAARDPLRHWPIVLVGLLGKILGPIGFVDAWARGAMPAAFGWTIITNDLIWWAPFALILLAAFRAYAAGPTPRAEGAISAEAAMRDTPTSSGATLAELSRGRDTLVVFLRHAGCTFCRETLADLSARRATLAQRGVGVVLVHMGDPEAASATFARYGLGDVPHISDPSRRLYRAFELSQGTLWQLFGPTVIWRGLSATLAGHRVGKLEGDGLQMPGAFVVRDGMVVRAFRHRTAADRPDLGELCELGGAR